MNTPLVEKKSPQLLSRASYKDIRTIEHIINHPRNRKYIGGPYKGREMVAKGIVYLWDNEGLFFFEPIRQDIWQMAICFRPGFKTRPATDAMREELQRLGVKIVMGYHKTKNRASDIFAKRHGGRFLYEANGNNFYMVTI